MASRNLELLSVLGLSDSDSAVSEDGPAAPTWIFRRHLLALGGGIAAASRISSLRDGFSYRRADGNEDPRISTPWLPLWRDAVLARLGGAAQASFHLRAPDLGDEGRIPTRLLNLPEAGPRFRAWARRAAAESMFLLARSSPSESARLRLAHRIDPLTGFRSRQGFLLIGGSAFAIRSDHPLLSDARTLESILLPWAGRQTLFELEFAAGSASTHEILEERISLEHPFDPQDAS